LHLARHTCVWRNYGWAMVVVGSIANQFAAAFGMMAAAIAVCGVAYMGLTFAHATSGILTAAVVLISCVGAHMVSRVVMHYPPSEHRHR
jgi:hypothetical protein